MHMHGNDPAAYLKKNSPTNSGLKAKNTVATVFFIGGSAGNRTKLGQNPEIRKKTGIAIKMA